MVVIFGFSRPKSMGISAAGYEFLPKLYFEQMSRLNKSLGFAELSMGMSSDFLEAIQHSATYVRVGSNIFGQRN